MDFGALAAALKELVQFGQTTLADGAVASYISSAVGLGAAQGVVGDDVGLVPVTRFGELVGQVVQILRNPNRPQQFLLQLFGWLNL